MVRRPLLVALSVLLVAACSGGDDDATPSATLATTPSSTTSTTLSVEAEVEAAYLRSWDVFAKAAIELDPSGLAESYAGPALKVVSDEIEELRAAGTPARYEVDHDYEILIDEATGIAQVNDTYVNHSVLLDSSGRATESDPNEVLTERYLLQRAEGTWKVFDFSRE